MPILGSPAVWEFKSLDRHVLFAIICAEKIFSSFFFFKLVRANGWYFSLKQLEQKLETR